MEDEGKFRELILSNARKVQDLHVPGIDPFLFLSEQIYHGKAKLKTNTVEFIVVKILNRNDRVMDLKRKGSFDVYVLGNFRKYFTPTFKVAEALSEFYLEMGILPNIISVPRAC